MDQSATVNEARFSAFATALAAAVTAIGETAFPDLLAQALQTLAPFGMMNGFYYTSDGKAGDLHNLHDRKRQGVIVDHYLDGAYVLDPFYDAVGNDKSERLLAMRALAPDDFFDSEYFRRHYRTTGIIDELGFVLDLGPTSVAVLSVSRMKGEPLFGAEEISLIGLFTPLVCATARRHWRGTGDNTEATSGRARIAHPLLTKRETEIVTLILKGHSNLSISAVLDLSPNTVKVHRRQIYAKLKISSQAELFHLFLA
ncbi:DNA-binding CsgD family transcriptional regulator [Rhizobium sp. SG_E_25_P2]|uniref:helix-turn-helix transcriptional regulator n=1 Tax=Rhizobium sp. SG_E_25_P2 TaxID=2879942 RepID=UPI002474702C|nr:helix-turn-helix transcriptional regulator [Rhizobium sp. SG_E_25_P2]MDH6264659.1 DNA-binding CsgD family transcriptional regulator [Rhizobium sp. SG_E_25_P2]